MSAGWDVILREIVDGSLSTAWNLLRVIVPLMIVIEILMTYHLVEKLAARMSWFARLLGVSRDAVLPIFVGLLMGVSYGAGTLIEINRRTPLSEKDFVLVGIFMFCCHGIIETAFLFCIAGANIWFLTVFRFLLAVVVTMMAARLPCFRFSRRKRSDSAPN